jgi:hypothetical protein
LVRGKVPTWTPEPRLTTPLLRPESFVRPYTWPSVRMSNGLPVVCSAPGSDGWSESTESPLSS